MISSWKRVGPNTIPHAAKATGIYLNSMLATHEARRGGYDEAILLTDDGYVADGPGENVFVVKDGVISTPPLSTSILPGITRETVMQLARDLGYEVVERSMIRPELYLADEVFMTGTAAEVTPVRAVDDQEIGAGPITLQLQQAYWDAVRGKNERYADWLDFVPVPRREQYLDDPRLIGRRSSAEPLGRQSPRSKSDADTSPPTIGAPAKNGCRCIGFQSGRASMSSASSASRIVSRSVPASSGSTRMQVSQQFDRPYARLRHERDPRRARRAARGSAR